MWNGVRLSLNSLDASIINTPKQVAQLNGSNILISIPYTPYKNDELTSYKKFVNNGGTLVLMDDFGYGNSILGYLNIDCRFSGAPLLDPLYCYKNEWFPKVTDFSPSVRKEVKEIILNHATALINTDKTEVIVWSSLSSYLDQNGNESWDEGELKGPLPVATKLHFGAGTIILVSDPSVLINSILIKNNNMLFIKYLTNSDANGEKVILDSSHLAQDPMELTKSKLFRIKQVLSQPYAVLGIVSLLFIISSTYMLKIGGSIGRKS